MCTLAGADGGSVIVVIVIRRYVLKPVSTETTRKTEFTFFLSVIIPRNITFCFVSCLRQVQSAIITPKEAVCRLTSCNSELPVKSVPENSNYTVITEANVAACFTFHPRVLQTAFEGEFNSLRT